MQLSQLVGSNQDKINNWLSGFQFCKQKKLIELVHKIRTNFDQKRNMFVNKHDIYQNFEKFI